MPATVPAALPTATVMLEVYWWHYALPVGLLLAVALAVKLIAPHIANRQFKNPLAFQTSGAHFWRHVELGLSEVKYCNVCEKVILGLIDSAVYCDVCNTHSHQRCLHHVDDSCKPLIVPPPAQPAQVRPEGSDGDSDEVASISCLQHHWVRGNLPSDSRCEVCHLSCASMYGLVGAQCQWCRATAHSACSPSLTACDLRELRGLVIPPWCFTSSGQPLASATAEAEAEAEGGAGAGAGAGATPSDEGAGQGGDASGADDGGIRNRISAVMHKFRDPEFRAYLRHIPQDVSAMSKRALRRLKRRWRQRVRSQRISYSCQSLPHGVTPVVVLVNPGSGGKMGPSLISVFRKLLHPLQVGDLSQEKPSEVLQRFASCPRLRILACGGDGTAAWVMSTVQELDMACSPAMAIMPLGTGNDLARVMKWGPGVSGTVTESMGRQWLQNVATSHVSMLDRWRVSISPAQEPAPQPADDADATVAPSPAAGAGLRQRRGVGRGSCARPRRGSAGSAAATAAPEQRVMANYMGVGVGAQVALQFHKLRKSYPNLFCSRATNKVWYSQVGGLEILRGAYANLPAHIELECDGQRVELPASTQGVIIMNINSYGGGADLWGREEQQLDGAAEFPVTEEFGAPSYADGVLEVVAVTGSFHLAQAQVGLSSAIRVAQCRQLKLSTFKAFPMQIDGEPTLQECSTINLSLLNQAVVLRRSLESSGVVASRFMDVLDWAQATGVVNSEQRSILMRELANRSRDLAT